MFKKHIGIIGMGVMGSNLAINIEQHGYKVSIFNRSKLKTNKIINDNPNKNLIPFYNLKEFVISLEKPRLIFLMIKAGKTIDEVINTIKPFLKKNDTVVDCGNSFYQDTIRRYYSLLKEDINFIGAGISGGVEGALYGASIMLGGQKEVCDALLIIINKIAAYFDNEPCAAYVGTDGAGHYVKMIHNSIEYADMQLIAEAYFLLKKILKLNNNQLSEIFFDWNNGELSSYLIEISAYIFQQKDAQNNFLIDMILDIAENKETGIWSSQNALELEEPVTIATESLFARYISTIKQQRKIASKIFSYSLLDQNDWDTHKLEFIEKLRQALYLSKIIAYAQGFAQLKSASYKNNWHLNYGKIAKIFRAGCIIRAKLLQKIADTYCIYNAEINNLLISPYFTNIINKYHISLREITSYAIRQGIPVPALSAAISYYDSYRSINLPVNLIQAQRDYFGAHTYQRIDKLGNFHTEWHKK